MGLTRLGPRRGDGHVQRPDLPTHLLLALPSQSTKPETRATSLLLVELYSDATSHSTPAPTDFAILRPRSRGKVLAYKGAYPGLDQGFKVCIVDCG